MISAFGVEHGDISKAMPFAPPRPPKHKYPAGKRKGVGRGKLTMINAATKGAKMQPQHPTFAVARTLARAVS